MNKIRLILNNIGRKRILFLSICLVIAFVISLFTSCIIGGVIAWLLGCAYTTCSNFKGNNYNGYDLLAVLVGSVLGALISLIF